jgi:signal transduction histidine kinase
MASHELRTPLTSLRGNLQLAERRLKQIQESGTYLTSAEGSTSLERLIVWIESALRQVKAESRLINDLLDATRIQTENLHISLEPCNLVQAVSDAVNDMRVAAYTRTIHLELPGQKEIPVLADSVRIEQVVTNYLSNALKYSAEREPVTVGFALEGHEARVWVKDAGLGLSPEAQRSIWRRFRRPSSFAEYTGLGVGGLGLGLYINQAVIQQHGGRVGVESAVGQGSTFWFTLPLAEA